MDTEKSSQESTLPGREALVTGLRTSPFFLVKDVVAAGEYYRDQLGFDSLSFWGEPECFCIARMGEASVMLSQPQKPLTIRPNWSQDNFSWDAHVLVDDARAHHEFCKQSGAKIVVELREAPYEMLEFIALDLDGYAICFGSNL